SRARCCCLSAMPDVSWPARPSRSMAGRCWRCRGPRCVGQDHAQRRNRLMKFYDCSTAPSARRVRIFMAEKGISIPTVQVDLRNGEQFSDAFRKINPDCTVPVLELDDGTVIADAIAI